MDDVRRKRGIKLPSIYGGTHTKQPLYIDKNEPILPLKQDFYREGENMKKVTIKKVRKPNGCDCWGRTEYDDYYIVEGKNGEVVYRGKSDPTDLINYLCNQ